MSKYRVGPRFGLPCPVRRATMALLAVFACVAASVVDASPANAAHSYRHLPAQSGAFTPSIGWTRSQIEQMFHSVAGNATIFQKAGAVKGVPRVLGRDERLFTIVEVNGYPEVRSLEVVTVLDVHSKKTLENQVTYDSLVCGELAGQSAQRWCLGRALNTDSLGLVTASAERTFGRLALTVRTFERTNSSEPPLVELTIGAA